MSEARLAATERRLHLLIVLNIAVLVAFASATCRTTAANDPKPQVLTVSEVDVVDTHGVIRARLGGDLPDAVLNGKRVPRGQKASGLLLYDDTGQERGGYITFAPGRQVALTLDARDQPGQVAILVADPDGSSALTLSNGKDLNNLVELRNDEDLGPSVHVTQNKRAAFHQPPQAIDRIAKTEMCTELRGALKSMTRDQVLTFCRQRASEEACQACLGE
jgi:hypothetical protein